MLWYSHKIRVSQACGRNAIEEEDYHLLTSRNSLVLSLYWLWAKRLLSVKQDFAYLYKIKLVYVHI